MLVVVGARKRGSPARPTAAATRLRHGTVEVLVVLGDSPNMHREPTRRPDAAQGAGLGSVEGRGRRPRGRDAVQRQDKRPRGAGRPGRGRAESAYGWWRGGLVTWCPGPHCTTPTPPLPGDWGFPLL